MTSPKSKKDDDPLIDALDTLGQGSKFLTMIFIMTITPMIIAGMHSMSYIFIAEIPSHWCAIPELTLANWTVDEIRQISSAGSCSKYNYNYTHFAVIGFIEALNYAERHEAPETSECTEYNYADDVERKSMVEEWNLVCNKAPERATTHMALSLGKLLGAGFLGVISDKYGRKTVYTIGIILLISCGPASAYIPWYWGFVILRLITGVSFSAIQFSSFTTLTEVAGNTHRQWMGITYNCGFASGSILVAGISYLTSEWRQIQLATSLPAIIFLLYIWLMPESPRWLIAQGRRKEAQIILEKSYGPIKPRVRMKTSISSISDSISMREETGRKDKNIQLQDNSEDLPVNKRKGLLIIFSNPELRKRALIMYYAWMSASLSYYALALNVDNFDVNYYIYSVLLGVTEIPAYILPNPMLTFMGRRTGSAILYILSAVLLLIILGIPRGCTAAVVSVALFARFALSAAYGFVILYTSELFPTVSRNSATGTSSSMAHVGSIIAPYAVDSIGALAWWGPSTLCGTLALFAGLLCLLLPETRRRSLANTAEEEVVEDRGVVSFRQCWRC